MKFNKAIIIGLLILIFFTLGAVSAAEGNISEPTDEILSVEPADSLEADESSGSFLDLESLIENTSAGDTLYLEKDYVNDESSIEGIDISNAITIDGKNHTIDANRASGIFNVKNTNVILKNINFVNSKYTAVNGKCSVYDCYFENCSDDSQGGAIRFKDNNIGKVHNSHFVNCCAKNGGAIYFEKKTDIINCSFVNCSSTNFGGAIFGYYPNRVVEGCSFVNCHSVNNGGGFYSQNAITTTRNSSFVNCSSEKYGGALYGSNAENCSFLDCTAGKNAAAIYNGNATGCSIINWYSPGGNAINRGNAYNSTVLESPHIIISTDFATPDRNFDVLVTISKNAVGNVRITINGITCKGRIDSGKANATFDGLAAGKYEIIASYAGNVKCCAQTVSGELVVGKIDQNMNVSVSQENYFGEPALISVETARDASGFVHILISGKDYKTKINNGKAAVNVSGIKVGTHNITVKYNGNYKYNAEETSATLEVIKGTPISSVSAEAISYGDNATVIVEFSSYVSGYVKILVDNNAIRTQIINHTASASFSGLNAGNHNVSAIYAGNSNYNMQKYETQLTVNKDTPIDSISHEVFNNGETVSITVRLKENVNGNIRITFNGTVYVCKIENGVASLNLSNLAGLCTVSVRYAGSANFEVQKMEYTFKVQCHLSPGLTVSYTLYSYGYVQFEFSIAEDAPGNINIKADGRIYKCPINSGHAHIGIPFKYDGQYTVEVSYAGNYKYDPQTITETITVQR
ncbi:Ig-like domain repeat protein [Methanobrevibacter sp.]